MAVSCAQLSSEMQQQVIAESSLRYSPTGEFQNLGNSAPYENRKDGSRGLIEFSGKTSDDADASYKVELYKARNHHNIGVDRGGVYAGFGQYICDPKRLFSVYAPGLSGVPHHEEMQSYASVFRRAAGGDANLVFRNIIRLIYDRDKIQELENLLFDIIGPVKLKVDFDPDRDLYVDVKISLNPDFDDKSFVPIDLCGTGALQVTQILAYVVLFMPKLLLIDEPDSHLHPSRQALLSAAFKRIIQNYDCKIIVSTHSRHLVSSAPDETKVIWLKDGTVESQENSGLVEILLDLGALDQVDANGAEIILCTEDKGKKPLERCLSSLGVDEHVKIISYNGITNVSSAAVIRAMADLFAVSPRVVIHRDRDFLTNEEVASWSKEFENRGMTVFCPGLNDIESYYVLPCHIAAVHRISIDEADEIFNAVAAKYETELRKKFRDKRQEANKRYWRDGGGPATADLWPDNEPMTEETMLGKELLPKINEALREKYVDSKNLLSEVNERLASDLREVLPLEPGD